MVRCLLSHGYRIQGTENRLTKDFRSWPVGSNSFDHQYRPNKFGPTIYCGIVRFLSQYIVICSFIVILGSILFLHRYEQTMRCPNCSSQMLIFDENATAKSLVKFFRCTNCMGEHISSEPLTENSQISDTRVEFFGSESFSMNKSFQMI